MPRMNNPAGLSNLLLAKLLLIGDGKLGKTYYAALAAKAGFNILYLDGDVGAQTISSMVASGTLTQEEASRIYLLDVRDTIAGGSRDTRFVEFMNEFASSIRFRWNDTHQRLAKRNDDPADVIWEITPGKMGGNDLFIMDSWTGYAESVMLWVARSNGVDLATASTPEMRPVYGGGQLKATEMLQVIRSMPTHVIVIAHPDEYQHTTVKEGTNKGKVKEGDQVVDWTKMIPKTTSKPQGLIMSKYFTDVAWMELSPAGTARHLNFKPKNDRVSGGHFTDSKPVDEYSFAKLVQQIGGSLPNKEPPAWLRIIDGSEAPVADATTPASDSSAKVLDGTKPAPIKGMAGLFAKKPAPAQA